MKTWQWLGYAGLLPFIIFLLLSELPSQNIAINPQQCFIFYSGSILCFLSGTLWISSNDKIKQQLTSNLFCLLAFLCFILPIKYALFILPLGYFLLLLAEYRFNSDVHNSFSTPYFFMRFTLTVSVIFLHGTAIILWLLL